MTDTTHEAPDDLVKRLRQPTGLNAFTQEPVQDKLKMAAADRIEELEAKLATCEKYRDAYAECDRIGTQAVRDLEAKLAKALKALECYAGYWADDKTFIRTDDGGELASETIAELTGGKDE